MSTTSGIPTVDPSSGAISIGAGDEGGKGAGRSLLRRNIGKSPRYVRVWIAARGRICNAGESSGYRIAGIDNHSCYLVEFKRISPMAKDHCTTLCKHRVAGQGITGCKIDRNIVPKGVACRYLDIPAVVNILA